MSDVNHQLFLLQQIAFMITILNKLWSKKNFTTSEQCKTNNGVQKLPDYCI